MKQTVFLISILIFTSLMTSCSPSGPSTLEVLNSFEPSLNEKDKEGMMALFAEDATITGYYVAWEWDLEGIEEIETGFIDKALNVPTILEFEVNNMDGDTVTFNWTLVGEIFTNNYLAEIVVQDGQITSLHWLEELETIRTGEE